MTPQIHHGFPPEDAEQAARLFWQAFREKLRLTLGPEDKAIAALRRMLNPGYALTARDADGNLIGLAGFKTGSGGLVGGDLRDLARVYGWIGALWRGQLLSLLERDIEPGVLLMDGIFVSETMRGKGVGSTLLRAIKSQAQELGLQAVRLDVVDTNPRAKALYLREGFTPVGQQNLGLLRHIFGFRSATQMIWQAAPESEPL